MVLFAGIAAEALVYGEAEGGENDENLFRSTCLLLQPPLSVAEVSLNPFTWSSYLRLLVVLKFCHFVSIIIMKRCQIRQDGLFYNLTICSNGIDMLTELLLKLWKVVAI